jgi:hypothetical protein
MNDGTFSALQATSMRLQPAGLGPIGWLFKLLVLVGKVIFYVVRLVVWILRRLFPGR